MGANLTNLYYYFVFKSSFLNEAPVNGYDKMLN